MAALSRLYLGLRLPKVPSGGHKPTLSARSFRLVEDTQSVDFPPEHTFYPG